MLNSNITFRGTRYMVGYTAGLLFNRKIQHNFNYYEGSDLAEVKTLEPITSDTLLSIIARLEKMDKLPIAIIFDKEPETL